MNKKKYFDYDVCKKCQGACCKAMAGAYIPSDFKEEITEKFLLSLFDSGKYSIDWWESDVMKKGRERSYYIRPRHVGAPIEDGSWGGVCVNWSQEKGCSLSEENRPYQCLKLIPNLDLGCIHSNKDKAGKDDIAKLWYKYNPIIDKVLNTLFINNKAT